MRFFCYVVVLFFGWIVNGQELPPIEKFTTSDYGGDNQNWMISQDANNFIYVANNKGLLEYNGSVWNTYLSPNNSILRAVKVIDDRIYTGCYEEFGYWKRSVYGKLEYISLVSKLPTTDIKDNQVWNIIDYDEWILFQTSHALYFFNKETEKFRTISSANIIYKVFKVNDQIYYHVAEEGVYMIERGESKLLINDSLVLKDRVISVFKNEEKLIVLTRNSGFFQFDNEVLVPWEIPANEKLKQLSIFNSIKLKDNSFVLGTISNGLVKINSKGEIEYTINQKQGLSNNTVLSLFEDEKSNVWVGLDNGIDCINLTSPIKTFIDYDGVLGTVYSTIIFDDLLYVGTNQGLFYRPLKWTNQDFTFVKGTAGQVWSLYNDNNENLLCGHHLGTFIINKGIAKNISPILGTWNFKKVPNREDLILQGNYDGLYVLEKKNNTWLFRNKIDGFKNSSRFFEINEAYQVLVNHEYKGVFDIRLNEALTKVDEVKLSEELSIGKNSSLATYQENIVYTSKDGVYVYDESKSKFKKDAALSALVKPKVYTSGKMVYDTTGKLWMFSQDNISFITNDNLTNTPEITDISIPSSLSKGVLGFENIQHINNEKYVIGTVSGYFILDLAEVENNTQYTIHLNAVKKKELESDDEWLVLSEKGEFDHKRGILSFNYSVPDFNKYLDVNYQYRLLGHSDKWSEWSKNSTVQFENLPFGDYEFQVKGKVGNQLTENTVVYNFMVNRPWYISNLSLLVYAIILIAIGFFVHKAYKFYYERILKHEQIKNERTIIQIKNEKLNQDIEGKNRELAISTMSIIKKNELLRKIKKELKNKEDTSSAIELIDNNLNNNKDWKFFKQAFNNADKDFMDKIKAAHPDLTPNDLKFCAYLRLNLSSKEMAPLLNISTKSVETKRYRLRKRLNLNHDESLVNYILKF
ncbi:helix-turn-helix and ligand-binding sensor domain-containing protein [Winogradskyella pulchriflava]|uniref:Triple tyrosine motif-containing protein n=1 Tax=Winogradskyella pulchriflava TaxID=1110688 RepID=A0ABV6QCQ7_9FLAO